MEFDFMAIFGIIKTAIGLASTPGGVAVVVVLLIAHRLIPNKIIRGIVGKCGRGLGTTITLGLGKWKWTKGFWNKWIEPLFIDLIENIPIWFFQSIIVGMKSDNPS